MGFFSSGGNSLLSLLDTVASQRRMQDAQKMELMTKGFVPKAPQGPSGLLNTLLNPGRMDPQDFTAAPWNPQVAETERARMAQKTTERGQDINRELQTRTLDLQEASQGLQDKWKTWDKAIADAQISQGWDRNNISWEQIQNDKNLREQALKLEETLGRQGLKLKFMEMVNGQWWITEAGGNRIAVKIQGMGAGTDQTNLGKAPGTEISPRTSVDAITRALTEVQRAIAQAQKEGKDTKVLEAQRDELLNKLMQFQTPGPIPDGQAADILSQQGF